MIYFLKTNYNSKAKLFLIFQWLRRIRLGFFAGMQDSVGRPRVCDDGSEISRLLSKHFPCVSSAGNIFPEYGAAEEDQTDIMAMREFQAFLQDMTNNKNKMKDNIYF